MLTKLTAVLLTALLALSLCAEPIVLVKNSRPAAKIVLPLNASKKLQLAAGDLQLYIRKISGVPLPVINSDSPVENAIHIWQNHMFDPAERFTRKDDPDAYAIKVRSGKVFIYGRTDTAVTFGVYSLLQEVFGVRWFAPGEDWEYVPRAAGGKQIAGEFVVDIKDKRYSPSISPRLWAGHSYTPVLDQWCRRQKVLSNNIRRKGNFANNIYRVFPPEKYAGTHPEYYPLVTGKRYIPAPGEVKWRPCESNPEVQKILVQYIRDFFDKNPDTDSFSLGLDDVFHICSCPNCIAMDNQPDDIYKKRFSSRHYKFVNIIAREVRKTHPDRFIGTLIYSPTLQPPVDVPVMEPNTFGFITQNCAMWKNPEIRRKNMELTDRWAKRIPYLSRYEYIGLSCVTPRYYPHLLEEAFRYDLKHNFQGMYQEVCTFLPLTAPMVWALSELQWDAGKNIDVLLDEYMQKVYGDAAAEMKEFYDHLEKCWLASPGDVWIYNNLIGQSQVMTADQLKKAYALLKKAFERTRDPLIQKRIKLTEDSLRYGGYLIEQFAMGKAAQQIQLKSSGDAEKIMLLAMKFAALAAERERFWAASMKADNVFGETLRGQSKRGNLVSNGQISTLEAIMADAAIDALLLLQKNDKTLFDQQLEKLRNAPVCAFTRTVIAATLPADRKSRNLLPNASFEQTKPNGEPSHWIAWGAVPDIFPVDKNAGRNGGSAARVNYNIGACFLYLMPVKPGEKFYAEVWVKGSGKGKGTVQFRFKNKNGQWHPNREEEPRINSDFDGQWRKLRLFCTVPEGAAIMQFSVGGYRIADGAHVLLDDAVLQKIYSEAELTQTLR